MSVMTILQQLWRNVLKTLTTVQAGNILSLINVGSRVPYGAFLLLSFTLPVLLPHS